MDMSPKDYAARGNDKDSDGSTGGRAPRCHCSGRAGAFRRNPRRDKATRGAVRRRISVIPAARRRSSRPFGQGRPEVRVIAARRPTARAHHSDVLVNNAEMC